MACAFPPPPSTFTKEAENCIRLVQLLRGPGCTALQNVLVQCSTREYAQPSFDKVLLDPGVKAILTNLHRRGRKLTKGQWLILYGRHFPQEDINQLGKPKTLDITLTFLLVRNICGLAPPNLPPGSPPGTKPWDVEPIPADTSLEANLARIKFYRNHLCHHETGKIPDHEFNAIFATLEQAIVDISTNLSLPSPQWSVCPADLGKFRIDPISQDDAEELENMRKDWRQQEKDILDELASIKDGIKETDVSRKADYEKQDKKMDQILEKLTEKDGTNVTVQKENRGILVDEDIRNLQMALCSYFRDHMSHIQRLPTDEHDTMILKDVFVKLGFNQSVLKNTKKEIRPLQHYSEAFKIAGKGYRLLVEGEPGVGKTTFVQKVTMDWVDVIDNTQKNVVKELQEFDLLFVVSLRFVDKSTPLTSILIDQHGLRIEKEDLEKILESYDRILLILDGYDEFSVGICPQMDAIIERKLFKNLTVLMTSRPWKSMPFSTTQRFFQFHFKIEGFRAFEDIQEFVRKFFQDELKADSFVIQIKKKRLFELSKVPLMLLIFCLLFDEEGQSLPSDQHILYWKLMNWFYMRYTAKGGQCDMTLEEIILKIGKIALQGTLKGQLLFKREEVEKELGSDVFEMGFLSSQKIRGFTASNISVSFPHKSIQDYVAGYFLAHSDNGWDMLNNIPQSKLVGQFSIDANVYKFAVKISDKCLPHALGLFDPLRDNRVFDFVSKYKNKERIRDVNHDTGMSYELYFHYHTLAYSQNNISSHCYPSHIVISTRNLDPTDTVSSPLPKALSSGTITVRDIVDESETVLACVKVDSGFRNSNDDDKLFAFMLLTTSKVITIGFYEDDWIKEQRKDKILRCLTGCGLECLSVLGLWHRDYSMPEIREMCHKSKDLRVLDLPYCKITGDLTSNVCELVVKHPNLCQLNLSGNKNIDWEYLLTHLLRSSLKTLRALMLRDCNIPENVALILIAFIKAQRDLVTLDLSHNDDLANILFQIVQMVPETIYNWVSLGLGPISSEQSETLKSVISHSPNLRELKLIDCQCDVSKEVIEKQSLEILIISYDDEWVDQDSDSDSDSENDGIEMYLDVGYILRHIHKLQKLRKITALSCCIGDDIMDHLIQNLHKNPNLTWIDFRGNSINKEKVNILRSTCDWVDIWTSDISSDFDYFALKHYINQT